MFPNQSLKKLQSLGCEILRTGYIISSSPWLTNELSNKIHDCSCNIMFEFITHCKHHHLFLRNTWAPLHIIFGSNLKDISQCPFASIILHNIAHTHLCDESSIDLVERSLKECCHFDVNGRDNRRTQNEVPTAWAKTETSPSNGITGSTMTSTNENELADFSCLSQAVGIK